MIQMSKRMSRQKRKELTTTVGKGKKTPKGQPVSKLAAIKEMKIEEVIKRTAFLKQREKGLSETGQKSLRILKQRLEGEVEKLELECLSDTAPRLSNHLPLIKQINSALGRGTPLRLLSKKEITAEIESIKPRTAEDARRKVRLQEELKLRNEAHHKK